MKANPSSRHLREVPPRHLGFFTKTTIFFGGMFQQMGWVFFLVGSIFCWVFLPASEVKFWFEFGKDWQEVSGKVLLVDPTNSSVNDVKIYRCLHSFELDGKPFTGKSYTKGKKYQGGENVQVRYDANDPENSYIVGSNRAVFPVWVLFVLLFPIVGLALVGTTIWKNIKSLKLLKNGSFTRGALISKVPTGGSVSEDGDTQPIFLYTFEFTVGGRKHAATCKTHLSEKVEDEEKEIILYDRFNPNYNVVYDGAPVMPGITEHGMLAAAPASKTLVLLLPLLSVAVLLFLLFAGPFNLPW